MEDSSGCPKQTEATAVSGLEVIKTRQFANKAKFPLSNETRGLPDTWERKDRSALDAWEDAFK